MTERADTTVRRSIRNAERIRSLQRELKLLKAFMQAAYDEAADQRRRK